jgi:Amt family ammonium transporter
LALTNERALNVLILEDQPSDAELALHALRRSGFVPVWRRVDTEDGYRAALDPALDLILADHTMPQFDSLRALEVMQEHGLDIPFIVVSGTIGEEQAVEALAHGASDYLLKDRLTRLGSAVERALERRRLRDERRAADDALRASEYNYRMLLDQAADGIVVADPAGRILLANSRVHSMLGYSPDELRGRALTEFIDTDDLTAHPMRAAELRAGATLLNERLLSRKDGSLLPAETSSTCLDDGRIQVIVRDITERKQAEERLREAERSFRSLVEQSSAVLYRTPAARLDAVLYVSPRVVELTGVSQEEWLEHGDDLFAQLLHQDDRDWVLAHEEQANRTGMPFRIEFRFIARDGHVVWIQDEARLIHDDGGQPLYWQGFWIDISERKRAEDALRRSEELYRTLAHHFPNGYVILFDRELRAQIAEGEALADFGLTSEMVEGRTAREVLPEALSRLLEPYLQAALDGVASSREVTTDTSTYLVHMLPVRDQDGTIFGGLTVGQDITERKKFERQLEQQMFFDALTGLPNRALFQNRLAHAVERAARDDAAIAVLAFDLDRFKTINESLGQAVGDAVLQAVAERLTASVRSVDTVARISADEFAILIEDMSHDSMPIDTARRIITPLALPVMIDHTETVLTASVGIAVETPRPGQSLDLLRDASAALFRAKSRGRGQFELFDASLQTQALAQLALEADLRRAIDRGELCVVYQPIIDLGTTSIVGAEALVRWQHPDRGLISPDKFIPLAEESDLIVDIDRFVLAEACRRLNSWNRLRTSEQRLHVSVNLSARNLRQPDIGEQIAGILSTSDCSPQQLQLELTESILLADADATFATLNGLRAFGIRLAIDDFGTGYSSLSYLTHFPVDVVKIDRSFISWPGMSQRMLPIVAGITQLCHALELTVVAEGIETAGQLARTKVAGCDYAQGYFFSKPVPAADFEVLLRTSAA